MPSGTDRPDPAVPAPTLRARARSGAVPLETQRLIGVFGSNTRGGAWEPAERVDAVAVFGGAKLDFRSARLYDVTTVQCLCLFGSVEILVPPDVEVDANGLGIFGGFEEHRRGRSLVGAIGRALRGESDADEEPTDGPDEDPPLLHIRGLALFGNVTVKVG